MTVVRSGLSLVMVGRAGELRRLQSMTDAMTEPRVVLLHGEAGVGKSRLVREFVATLPDHQVFAAHAEPGPLGRPFHLLHEAIERRVATWTSIPARARELRGSAAGLARAGRPDPVQRPQH